MPRFASSEDEKPNMIRESDRHRTSTSAAPLSECQGDAHQSQPPTSPHTPTRDTTCLYHLPLGTAGPVSFREEALEALSGCTGEVQSHQPEHFVTSPISRTASESSIKRFEDHAAAPHFQRTLRPRCQYDQVPNLGRSSRLTTPTFSCGVDALPDALLSRAALTVPFTRAASPLPPCIVEAQTAEDVSASGRHETAAKFEHDRCRSRGTATRFRLNQPVSYPTKSMPHQEILLDDDIDMRPRSVPLQCRQDEDLQVDQRDGNSEAREIELKLIAGSIWTKGDLLALQLAAGRPLSPLATAYLLARDDEENDSENPRNWSRARKWSATIVVSLQVFLATFGVAHLAPALGYISKDLGIHSGIQRGAIIAVYIASFSIAHLIHSPISEAWGRRPVLVGGLVIYLLFNSLCAIATNTRTLLAFRFFSGVGACAPLGTGGAVLIDLWHPDDRALALSIFSIAPQLGPLVGPIMGGYMTQQLGDSWRLGLGLTSAAIAIALGATVLLVPETLAARIPHLRARELRAEQGVKALCAAYEQTERSAAPFAAEVVLRPIILLSCEPAIQLAATHLGVCFSVFYLMATTFPAVYGTCYGEKPGIASLHYIAIFVGTMIGAALSSRSLHLNRGCAPESKFRPLMWFGCFPTCGMLVYGWSTCNGLHWLLADLGVTVFACGLAVSVVIVQSYLAECYSLLAASALSASVLTRSLLGFAAPLLGETLYHHLGLGWGNTLLAVFAGLVGIPLPFIMLRHGQAFRLASRYATKSSDIGSDPCAQSS